MSELMTFPAWPRHARAFLSIPMGHVGQDSSWINRSATQLISRLSSPATIVGSPTTQATLEEKLYSSRAACKIRTAAVAMHLNREWRARFFTQVDSLLSVDDWDEHDEPITEASFTTLLRMILLIRPKRLPGLGATSDGNVIATWTVGKDRLTVECLSLDEVRWVLVRYLDGERESAAGQTALLRFLDVLQPYNPEIWFGD
jgi:hypothetical protein